MSCFIQADRYYQEQEQKHQKLVKRLPVCSECGRPIEDEYAFWMFNIWTCEGCMDKYRFPVVYADE